MIVKERATPDRNAAGRSVFSSTLAACCVFVVGVALVSIAAERRNRSTAAEEDVAIQRALAGEIGTMGERLRAFAALTPVRPQLPGPQRMPGPFWRLFLIGPRAADVVETPAATDPVNAALARFLHPAAAGAGLRGAFEPTPELLPDGVSRAAVMRIGDDAVLAVALGTGGRGEPQRDAELIALQPIDDGMLARIARTAGTRPLTLARRVDEVDGAREVSLTDDEPASDLALTWMPDTPGDRLAAVGGIALALCIGLFATLILFRARRVTRELVESEARAKADAAHDLLTGLPNRSSFQRALGREIARFGEGTRPGAVAGTGFAVLYIDIDRFKEINDTFGHAAGDRVIVASAQRIMQALRPGDRVARIGGDEFAVLMSRAGAPLECASLARRVLEAFAEPIELGSHGALVTLSIGIALCPSDATTADALTSSADMALYRAKNEGRNRYCFFETRMGEELRMRRTVEDDLRQAIETDQLVMEYQPVVALDGQSMLGVEALVRWRHPVQGTISPSSFITLAEECGLILPLGEWVLRQAMQQVRRWPNLRVAVNVSAIQFRHKDFVATVQRLLEETGIEPAQLELELTESVLLADADLAEDAMIELRAMGVRLALDDFGTGYSSLIYLRRFAFDKIKIDRSFLESTETTGESAIIVHSIVHLGRALGLTVTAEGVETADQHRFLQALGCHELQGFLFSPPISAAAIDARLAARSPTPLRSVA